VGSVGGDALAFRALVVRGDHDDFAEAGNAAQLLIEEATGADLLVVGTRGHGGFAGLLLGSVSQHVAAYASCPVAVIR
jgi:nucleotide-binding universal stress UspA family protein